MMTGAVFVSLLCFAALSSGGLGEVLQMSVCPSTKTIGSKDHSSLTSATNSLAALRSAGHTGDIMIELCEGRHPLSAPVVLTDSHSSNVGTTSFVGLGSGAIIDAGYQISGWVPVPDPKRSVAMLQARIPTVASLESRQLWVDGSRATRAHAAAAECSGGPVDPAVPCPALLGGTLTSTGYSNVPIIAKGRPALGAWLVGSELVYGRGASGASWTEPRCTVADVTPATNGTVNIVVEPICWKLATSKGSQSVRYPSDIENAQALLDTPGEWYADFKAGIVYYAQLPGQTASSINAILGTTPKPQGNALPGAAISVLAGTQNLHFEGLAFKYLTWLKPSRPGGFVDLQSAFYMTSTSRGKGPLHGVPGAIWLSGVKNVDIQNCTFDHLGLSGVVADGGSQYVNVTRSAFSDLSGSAVTLGNVSTPLASPDTQDAHFWVTSNRIKFTGQEYRGSAGIFAGYVAYTNILNNAIQDTSNGAVCLGWGWGANNTMRRNNVSFNHITRSNTILYDCGSIYTLSAQPGSEIAYNYIENQVLLYGSLYFDARSSGFSVHNNVVVGGPMWLYLQWGTLGAVNHLTIMNNFHNQTNAGGCATKAHSATCQSTGFCPTRYPPSTCGGVIIQNNIQVNGSSFPAAARAIESAAGPQL